MALNYFILEQFDHHYIPLIIFINLDYGLEGVCIEGVLIDFAIFIVQDWWLRKLGTW